MGCLEFEGDVGDEGGSETAKLDVDMEWMLTLQALVLSLPEYSESGYNGEFPPLREPFWVAELPRRRRL